MTQCVQLTSSFIFALDLARMPIKSAMVSEFGSSMMRVSLEGAHGESSLVSALASGVDRGSAAFMGDRGRAVAVVVPVMMKSPWFRLEGELT